MVRVFTFLSLILCYSYFVLSFPYGLYPIFCVTSRNLFTINEIDLFYREVNPIFEGNQQHDAHELLVCLLDNIRETCRHLADQHKLASEQQSNGSLIDPLDTGPILTQTTASSNTSKWNVRRSWKRKKGPSSSQKFNGLPNGLSPDHPHLLNGSIMGPPPPTGE